VKLIIASVLLAILAVAPMNAAVRRFCKVSYQREYDWSDEYKMEVTFMTGYELNKVTRTFDYTSYSKYALIWFDKNEVAILEIDDLIIAGLEFTAENFIYAFSVFSEKSATQVNSPSPRKWKIEAKEYFRWIDPRLQ